MRRRGKGEKERKREREEGGSKRPKNMSHDISGANWRAAYHFSTWRVHTQARAANGAKWSVL